VLACTGNPPEHWFGRTPDPLEIDIELAAVARKMQGRARSELRKLMSEAAARKEQDRKDHKFKRLIRAITAKAINPYSMETLQNLDGSMTSDPTEIHNILTAWFSKWFAYDRCTTGTLHEQNNWEKFLHDEDQFSAMLEGTSITPDIKAILWKALHTTTARLTQEDRQEIETILNYAPNV